MSLMPCPTPLDGPVAAESQVEEHRNLYCGHYEGCLDTAVQLDWRGWTCARCPYFNQPTLRPDATVYAVSGRRD